MVCRQSGLTFFRCDVSRVTGRVMLLMETDSGYKPVMGWASADGLEEFARMLLSLHEHIQKESGRNADE